MLKIFFDPFFDKPVWPKWTTHRQATLGEIRVGQMGMLGILETRLGLRAPEVPAGVRMASLIPTLKDHPQAYWSRSVVVDPFGVARELLRVHDYLSLHGWTDMPVSSRIAQLSSLTPSILPGVPQRLRVVLKELDDVDGRIFQVTLINSIESLPYLWQKIFQKIADQGGTLDIISLAEINPNDNDLGKAQKSDFFTPSADGSLQLLRPQGALQASEDIAAWLAAIHNHEGLQDTLIIGSDSLLDTALCRFGLPVSGAPSKTSSTLVQLLPLILAMGWNPPDPTQVMEFLTLSVTPVPRSIRFDLIKALKKWPALGSDIWAQQLEKGLSKIEDHAQKANIAKRMHILFTPTEKFRYSAKTLSLRVNLLVSWLRSRFQDDPIAYPALNQCRIFLSIVEALAIDDLDDALLKKVIDETFASLPEISHFSAEAGLNTVASPETVLGPVKRIIWWNFCRDQISPLDVPFLSQAEQKALADAAVILPDSTHLAQTRANNWRRPLQFAGQQIIFVCPQRNALGDENHPHPLWDEISAASRGSADRLIYETVRDTLHPETFSPPTILPLPTPHTQWRVSPGSIKARAKESPSSIESFLGCPLRWCLNYIGRIARRQETALPNLTPVLGTLAHELIEKVLTRKILPSPKDGTILAEQLFDDWAPRHVACLFQEGMEATQQKFRSNLKMATHSLLEHLHDVGAQDITTEKLLTGMFKGRTLQGRADVVLNQPCTVIDLKRSWSKFFSKKLSSGTAIQIVLYGWLIKEMTGIFPGLAYFTIEDQTMLTSDPHLFPKGIPVEAPPFEYIWEAFEQSFDDGWDLIGSGQVRCPGCEIDNNIPKSEIKEGRLFIEPPCRFCEYDVLCGRRFK
jgi:hypothetical protein